mmetsp:Transcript_15747/g.15886  ORF Transcript_15747/g.15886 Transcript_15747/m.15886 type:complete len:985 (+) Transcript_15747:82-3036(+)
MLQRLCRVSTRNVAKVTLSRGLSANIFAPTDQFLIRHVGSQGKDKDDMLKVVGFNSLEELLDSTLPAAIKLNKNLNLDAPMSESEALAKLKGILSKNQVKKSFIGMGYYETLLPGVIQRNVLENPGWYTAYTPYQAEIAQGRLQALLNFQTMVADLVGMSLSNASLLDEATAAAEAMTMCYSLRSQKRKKFFVDADCFPQTIALAQTRGEAIGIQVEVGDADANVAKFASGEYCGVLVQNPGCSGVVKDLTGFCGELHKSETLVVAATDLLASVMMKPVGEMNVDIAVGSAQRFGVPMGFGGPHAAFLATTDAYSRKIPGRIIGVSLDSRGKNCLRMAMQTREQHIRRDKATSNICTAQALLANMAGMYGVYHGPDGLAKIAGRVHNMAVTAAETLKAEGMKVSTAPFFDTFTVDMGPGGAAKVQSKAAELGINVRVVDDSTVGVSFGEAITREDTEKLMTAFGASPSGLDKMMGPKTMAANLARTSAYLTHPVFNTHRSETQMLRYLKYLENKDLSLNTSMISLGSCTMKLNASVEMVPVTWPETCDMHPFAPVDQTEGYIEMIESLNKDLAEITGFAAVSTQPNSGAQGEYAGLLCIRAYHKANGQGHRNVCLIPMSAHGTNPASASMCGMKVVVVKSDDEGNVDIEDFKAKALKHKDHLAALMVTYPSTYGKFEEEIKNICDLVHSYGGQVYMDGANMNAQVAITSPGFIGADVCHLNLHKTFCIPHGGGGPGVGSIGVVEHLAPFLPGHPVIPCGGEGLNTVAKSGGTVSAAPYGSAAILPISWMYIKMLGEPGLKESTGMAILNANYMAKKLEEDDAFDILFRGKNGQCAHEFIMDLRPFKEHGIVEEDVAKRLQDYGFHSPTMSWPVPGTLMIEPTESEDRHELDRFVWALRSIRVEIGEIMTGAIKVEDSPLKGAPHTLDMLLSDSWSKPYSREEAAFPAPWTTAANKFWPTVGRVDNVYGDRNLVCTCPPIEDYME